MGKLFYLLISIPQTLMAGLVFSHLWNWFIIRKFAELPHLGIMDSVGLLMVANFPRLGHAVMNAKKELREKHPDMSDDAADISLSIVMTTLVYPILLGVAWIWSRVIGG